MMMKGGKGIEDMNCVVIKTAGLPTWMNVMKMSKTGTDVSY